MKETVKTKLINAEEQKIIYVFNAIGSIMRITVERELTYLKDSFEKLTGL